MPRYFLDLCYESSAVDDDDGFEFDDLPAACAEAERVMREVVANCIRESRPALPRRVEVRTADGAVAATVALSTILPDLSK